MDFRNERASRLLLIVGLITAAALSRLIPHPPNFSPIEATALFAGAAFADRRLALLVPIAAMLLSDFFLGFHAGMPVVYGSIALMAWFGRGLATKRAPLRIAAYGLASAVFFFTATNLFVWLGSGMYPLNGAGLAECFTLALPFFQHQLAGVAFYSAVLFGAFALLEKGSEPALTPSHLRRGQSGL